MLKLKQQLTQLGAKRRAAEPGGPLSGRQIAVGEHVLRVGALLGEGGFATIYRACDAALPEDSYALKHFRLRWVGGVGVVGAERA